jgi:uncharacterized protein YdiU (UPF0061 family)
MAPYLHLSFFLLTNYVDEAGRSYRHLPRVYHDALEEFLRDQGSNYDNIFTFSALQEEIKKYSASCIQQEEEEESFYQKIGLKSEEETSEMLHLEHGFVWC